MNYKIVAFFLGFACLSLAANAQQEIKWWNPQGSAINAIEGQGWQGEYESFYDRLPLRAKSVVRPAVWARSKFSSGLTIRFKTNSPHIQVRYKVAGRLTLPTMPAVAASGVDLYAVVGDKYYWCRPATTFRDTIVYKYTGLKPTPGYYDEGVEYKLFLPPYNSILSLEIGVYKDKMFMPLVPRDELPIVVYGTSITQGGCASRPGMTWTSILQRHLNRPVINLGFSGNGRLEPEVINLVCELDAAVYVLDCLANLTSAKLYDNEKLGALIMDAVKDIRAKHPDTPIVLTDHDGYTSGFEGAVSQRRYYNYYSRVNKVMDKVFAKLKKQGVKQIYHLTHDDIDQSPDGKVDGTHPNDLGMMRIATAYEKIIREILNEK